MTACKQQIFFLRGFLNLIFLFLKNNFRQKVADPLILIRYLKYLKIGDKAPICDVEYGVHS